jgi:hypothetical protein
MRCTGDSVLKLDRLEKAIDSQIAVEIDSYVPVTLEIADQGAEPALYWRAKPDSRTLVEIGMSSSSGRFRSLTVTSLDRSSVVETATQPTEPELSESEGVPCFDISRWGNSVDFSARFLDERVSVRLLISPNSCVLEFGGPTNYVKGVRMRNLRCLFDDHNALARVDVTGLAKSALDVLRNFA